MLSSATGNEGRHLCDPSFLIYVPAKCLGEGAQYIFRHETDLSSVIFNWKIRQETETRNVLWLSALTEPENGNCPKGWRAQSYRPELPRLEGMAEGLPG